MRHLYLVPAELPQTLTQNIVAFLDAKKIRSPNTLRSYRLVLYRFLNTRPHWPLQASEINAYLAGLAKSGLKDSTVHFYYRTLRTFCNWLHDHGRLADNPIALVEQPRRVRRRIPRAPRLSILKRFFNAIAIEDDWKAVRDLALFCLLLDTGMRVGEVSALDLDHVDLDRREIIVPSIKVDAERVVVFTHKIAVSIDGSA